MEEVSSLSHIGIIMDGNRRWARKKGIPVYDGHFEGIKRVRPVIERAQALGIKHISFFALSEDNLLRDPREVSALMRLFREFFNGSDIQDLMQQDVRIDALGNYQRLPQDIVSKVNEIKEKTKNNQKISVHFALCYDGANEILQAAQALVAKKVKKVSRAIFEKELYGHGTIPALDLVIRTGGEQRLSGFLLWHAKYAELKFNKEFWPDYTPAKLLRDLKWFRSRERRFGK